MKLILVLFFVTILAPPVFASTVTGEVFVNVSELEATVRVEGPAAQKLFESLDVPQEAHDLTMIKQTNEMACFQHNSEKQPTYTCVIFVFVNKDFISTKSRYLKVSGSVP